MSRITDVKHFFPLHDHVEILRTCLATGVSRVRLSPGQLSLASSDHFRSSFTGNFSRLTVRRDYYYYHHHFSLERDHLTHCLLFSQSFYHEDFLLPVYRSGKNFLFLSSLSLFLSWIYCSIFFSLSFFSEWMECINEITPFDLSLEKMLEYLNKIFLDFNREFFSF